MIRRHVERAWHSSRVGAALNPIVRDSVVCRAVAQGGLKADRLATGAWQRAEHLVAVAGRAESAQLTRDDLAVLRLAMADGVVGRIAARLASAWRGAVENSALRSIAIRWRDGFAGAPLSDAVLALGVFLLTAVVVHAAISGPQSLKAAWIAWVVIAAGAVALIAQRDTVANAIHVLSGSTDATATSKPLRLLVVTPFPEEGAGYRFRIGQYIPALKRAGYQITVKPFFTEDFFRIVYRPGNYLKKLAFLIVQTPRRLALIGARATHDLVFIYREALPIGPPVIELLLGRSGGLAVVYDYDDAVFVGDTSEANRVVAFVKAPSKTRSIIKASTSVIAGNEYLAAYARPLNPHVTVIPTCVDTDVFVPRQLPRAAGEPLIIGWIGSPTTVRYLEEYGRILEQLAERHRFTLRVGGAGRPVNVRGVTIDNVAWSLPREVELFNTCDIGIYPLPDNMWTRGKCGFKAIQFMACGVPVVASPVGVNCDIVRDGENGFLARTADEWVDRLSRLLDDEALRQRLGRAGRRTVDERYSLAHNTPLMLRTLSEAAARAQARADVR